MDLKRKPYGTVPPFSISVLDMKDMGTGESRIQTKHDFYYFLSRNGKLIKSYPSDDILSAEQIVEAFHNGTNFRKIKD